MKKSTKVTLSMLMDKVEKRKENKKEFKKFYIKSLDGYIVCEKPTRQYLEEVTGVEDGDHKLIYNHIVEPVLKDLECVKDGTFKRPVDVIDYLFEPGEVTNLARSIIGWAGYSDDSVVEVLNDEVEEIKN